MITEVVFSWREWVAGRGGRGWGAGRTLVPAPGPGWHSAPAPPPRSWCFRCGPAGRRGQGRWPGGPAVARVRGSGRDPDTSSAGRDGQVRRPGKYVKIKISSSLRILT